MASLKSIPLKLRSADSANLQSISVSDESYWTDAANQFLTDEYPSNVNKYYNSVTLSSAVADSVGRFTDTFYEQPIGTHPASSLSIGTSERTLYQSKKFAPHPASKKLAVGADSDGDFWEMDSAAFLEFGTRLLENAQGLGEGPTVFRLGTSLPVGNYAEWIPSAFIDTAKSGDTVYKIYRGEEGTPLTGAPNANPVKITNTFDVKEMSYDSCAEFCGAAMLFAQQETGIGDVQLRSSADGAPTDAGTWVARGIATDTRNITQNLQYATVQYTSPQYSTTYSLQYTGQYTGLSFANVDTPYAGTRPTTFSGSRNYASNYSGSRNYAGDYAGTRNYADQYTSAPTQFSGFRSFAGSRNYADQYTSEPVLFAGERTFAGTRPGFNPINYSGNYAGERAFNFLGQRNFVGVRQVFFDTAFNFSGVRSVSSPQPGNFTGNYSGNYAGNRGIGGNFVGDRPANYAGTRVFGPTGFSGSRVYFVQPNTENLPDDGFEVTFSGVYSGTRVTSGNFAGIITQAFAGVRPNPGVFSGSRDKVYAGVRIITNDYAGNFVGTRQILGPQPQNFIGGDFNFSGFRPDSFAGSRNYQQPAQFPGNFVGGRQFTGTRQFAGSRNYSTETPIGIRYASVGQFTGTRQFAGSRVYSGNYGGSRNYQGNYGGSRNYASNPAQYAGQTRPPSQFIGQVATTYTGYYSAQYTGQYTTSYTSQYSQQYTGETIVGLTQIIETFTLYQRISL